MHARKYLALLLVFCFTGCEDKKPDRTEGVAPPPIASSKPGACDSGGGNLTDKVSAAFFPRSAGGYCVDPNGEVRAFGKEASGTLDKVCTELFDGECEVYKSFGLERVVTLRYIDGKGSPGSVNVNLSRFAGKEGAYGFFTKRVIADGDPAEVAPAPLEAGGVAALGTGIAYVWRGQYVAELSYTNELEAPDQIKKTSSAVIPPIAKQIGEKLPGEKRPPKAVSLLPTESRISLGVYYQAKDAWSIAGVGPAAIGYYKQGTRRWRVVVLARPDEAGAKDIMKTLGKLSEAKKLKGTTFGGLRFTRQEDEESPKLRWVAARRGDVVMAVGDEELVLSSDQTDEAAEKVRLSDEDMLGHLQRMIAGDPGSSKEDKAQ